MMLNNQTVNQRRQNMYGTIIEDEDDEDNKLRASMAHQLH